jgi:hypothetical protein
VDFLPTTVLVNRHLGNGDQRPKAQAQITEHQKKLNRRTGQHNPDSGYHANQGKAKNRCHGYLQY